MEPGEQPQPPGAGGVAAVHFAAGVDRGELENQFYKSLLVQRIRDQLRSGLDEPTRLLPVLDEYQAEGSTATVNFRTTKTVEPATKSHLNVTVCDSELERAIAEQLEADPRVLAYAKNDHLFFEIPYRFDARNLRYIPDFLVRLGNGTTLILEGKGRATSRDASKASAATRWVNAVNSDGCWGTWAYALAYTAGDVTAAIDNATPASPVAAPREKKVVPRD